MRVIEHFDFNKHPFMFNYNAKTTDNLFQMFHAHQGLEFLFIEQGNGHIIIEQQLVPLHPPMLFIFQPYQLHRIHVTASKEMPYVRSIFVVEPHALEPYLLQFPSLRAFFRRTWLELLPTQALLLDSEQALALKNALLLTHSEREQVKTYQQEQKDEATALGALNVLRLLRTMPDLFLSQLNNRPLREAHLAEQTMAWIEEHFREAFSLQSLADSLHVSPHYLSHLFRQDTGSSITEYMIARRLREACFLLETSDMPVKDIALKLGLSAISYFVQLFKKHMGITPYQYRLKRRKSFI
ncbi:AraC family transcriptional regulator [Paenibacillus psychroresistens]|uniref:AraC family transcriptional regulator n=1 Tax=Paenibacillus psychroresistens TaxID=1778678 RepID=A0A6B8RRD4_9BACL|nr:AraC family transcriptional regulator [Paenibacillus psychroresistens]QGQ98417.1 AraC family transcriptional regulator [Paenibacillus psychroresistens]